MRAANLPPSNPTPDYAASLMRAALEPLLSLTVSLGIEMEATGARDESTRQVQRMACGVDNAMTRFDREPDVDENRMKLRECTETLTLFARSVANEISRYPGRAGTLGVKQIRNYAQDGDRAIKMFDEAMTRARSNGKRTTSLVLSRKNRITGETIELHDAEVEGCMFDPSGGRWITYCVAHGTLCNHRTKALASAGMTVPEWCEECMERVRALIEVE